MSRPIILVGTGRCGSTLLHQVLSVHPGLAWLTPFTHRAPRQPWVTRWALHAVDAVPPVRRFIRPSEAYPFWNHYCPNFGRTPRDLVAADLGGDCARGVTDAFARMPTRRRSRLLLKVTGWPRTGFLDALFEEPVFVHIRRDGRAVANSWLGVDWWPGASGPDGWRWGPLEADQRARYEASGRSAVALAAIAWEILMDAHEAALRALPTGRLLELTYEELCDTPTDVVKRVAGFADLDWTQSFEREVSRIDIRNANEGWRRGLSADDQRVLEDTIRPALERHGYV